MSVLKFMAALVSILAWPSVILFIVLILRPSDER